MQGCSLCLSVLSKMLLFDDDRGFLSPLEIKLLSTLATLTLVFSVCRETHASVCSVCGLPGRGSQDHLHQVQVTVGWQLAPAGHHVHLRHPGCLSLLSGPSELQALWQACDRRTDRDAVLFWVQQCPAVSTLWEPGLPFREAILLLQSSRSLLMKALL